MAPNPRDSYWCVHNDGNRQAGRRIMAEWINGCIQAVSWFVNITVGNDFLGPCGQNLRRKRRCLTISVGIANKIYYYWFQTFAVFWMLYDFFWVVPRRLNFICRRFGTLCSIFIGRKVCVEWTRFDKCWGVYGKRFTSSQTFSRRHPNIYQT
jgi:hypothetical protein